jgi:hypothetical protein
MKPGDIRAFTATVAATVAAEHAGDPASELTIWLQLALRREASVGELYGVGNLHRRLADVRAPREMRSLIAVTIGSIWAQEKAHAAYLQAALVAAARPRGLWHRLAARLDGVMGALEGLVLAGRTSPSQLGRARAGIMLAVGRRLQDIPGFVSELSQLSFRDYCELNAELEITATEGYERILELLARLPQPGDGTLAVDVARLAQDERYHYRTFLCLADLFEPCGSRVGADVPAAAARLAAIRAQSYGASASTGGMGHA